MYLSKQTTRHTEDVCTSAWTWQNAARGSNWTPGYHAQTQVRNNFHRIVNMYNERETLLSSFHLNEQTLGSHPDSKHLMPVAKQPTHRKVLLSGFHLIGHSWAFHLCTRKATLNSAINNTPFISCYATFGAYPRSRRVSYIERERRKNRKRRINPYRQ